MPTGPHYSSWIEINRAHWLDNTRVFRGILGETQLGGVLKGNAYGHGLEQAIDVLHGSVSWFYTITLDEALTVRAWERAHDCEESAILCIGALSENEIARAAEARIAVVAASVADMDRIRDACKATETPLAVHMHIDTGLSREGFAPSEVSAATRTLCQCPGVSVEGALTHFANTEDVSEQAYAERQLALFEEGLGHINRCLETCGYPEVAVRHLAASAAALVLPGSRADVARVGIALYGLWPSRETRLSAMLVLGRSIELKPVLAWKCRAQLIKKLPAGALVGYGCTYRCASETTIAVLPVGYADGYARAASGRAHVLVRGVRCPVIGRVMMNHIIVDVSGVPDPQDAMVATLIGRDGDEAVTVEEHAGWTQTIGYEVTTRLGAHLRRIIV
ncbi:MAG: alanine racemase [Myxococcota bacterium]